VGKSLSTDHDSYSATYVPARSLLPLAVANDCVLCDSPNTFYVLMDATWLTGTNRSRAVARFKLTLVWKSCSGTARDKAIAHFPTTSVECFQMVNVF
jgi:hypothetical protein